MTGPVKRSERRAGGWKEDRSERLFVALSQGTSSVGNSLLIVIAAHVASPASLGGLAVALLAYAVCLGLSRASSSEVALVSFGRSHDIPKMTSRVVTAAILSGTILGLAILLGSSVVLSPAQPYFILLGIAFPGLMLQDGFRLLAIGGRQARRAFYYDIAWTAGFAIIGGSLVPSGNVLAIFGAWLACAHLGAFVGFYLERPVLRFRECFKWLSATRSNWLRYCAEFLAVNGVAQASLLSVGWLLAPQDYGYLRVATTATAPVALVVAAVSVAELTRHAISDRRVKSRRTAMRLSWQMTAAALACAAIIYIMPSGLMKLFFGEAWQGAHALVPAIGLQVAAVAYSMGPVVVLRGEMRLRDSTLARALGGLSFVPLVILGSLWGGAIGAAWGLAAGSCIGACFLHLALRRSLSRQP